MFSDLKLSLHRYFVVLFLLFSQSVFGQVCIDLSREKVALESIYTLIDDNCDDKGNLDRMIPLLSSCVNHHGLKQIKRGFLSLRQDCPQSEAYKAIIESILSEHGISMSCMTLGEIENESIGVSFDKQIQDLIAAYADIEVNRPKLYGSDHRKNVEILDGIIKIFNKCEVNTSTLDSLANEIVLEGFGDLTNGFKTDLDDLILKLNEGKLDVKIVSCNTLGDELDYYKTSFDERLNYLINQYAILKNQTTIYGSDHENNLQVFNRLKAVFGQCLVNVDSIEYLKSSITTEGFGYLTNSFKNDLEDLINQLERGELKVKYVNRNKINNNEVKSGSVSKRDWSLLLIFLVIAIGGFFFIGFFKKNSMDKDSTLKELEKENQNLKGQIRILEGKLTNLEAIIDYDKSKADIKVELTNENITSVNTLNKTYYFSEPNPNGEFIPNNGSTSPKIGASIFKFHVNDEQDKAEFEFYHQASTFNKVVENPFETVLLVCNIDGEYDEKASEILTMNRGKLEMRNGIWVLKEKAIIKFIS